MLRLILSIRKSLTRVLFVFMLVSMVLACTAAKKSTTTKQHSDVVMVTASVDQKKQKTSVDEIDTAGIPLVLAARFGQTDIVKILLDSKKDVNMRDEFGNTALIAAAAEARDDIIKLLLKYRADVNAQSSDGGTALMAAASKGSVSTVIMLLDADARVGAKKHNVETALFNAVKFGHLDVVELLLSEGADPNIQNKGEFRNSRGFTPLMYAAQHGLGARGGDWMGIISALLAKGAETNIANANGDTPLSIAVRNRFSDIVDKLREAGAREGMPYASLSREEALLKATKTNDKEKVIELIEGRARMNYRNENTGLTPLLIAGFYQHHEIATMLVKAGADVNNIPWGMREERIATSSVPIRERELLRAASRGDTPLITAIRNANAISVRFLLDSGADVNLANKVDETPTLIAAREGLAVIMGLLLAKGADPNISKIEDITASFITNTAKKDTIKSLLIETTLNGHVETAKVLLDAGADPDIRDDNGRTALFWATEEGYSDIVNVLLENEADTGVTDNIGRTPLMMAAKIGYRKIVKLLLDHEADVNANEGKELEYSGGQVKVGNTALIYASRRGYVGIVRLLLSNGADITLRSNSGESALSAANKNGHEEIVQLLKAY